MRSLLLTVCVVCLASVAPAQTTTPQDTAAASHYSVSVGVGLFLLGEVEVGVTRQVSLSVGAGRGLGNIDPRTAYAKVIVYPSTPFDGLQLLLQAMYVRDSAYANGASPIPGISQAWYVGPMIGYKHIFDLGFTGSLEIGPVWFHSRTHFIDGYAWGDDRVLPFGYFTVGWSF